ncbi:MAG: glycoside hydrolase family 2 TIM barrel-domain containing protein [Terracidiphilus sp.]|jgi:hypothetical protein
MRKALAALLLPVVLSMPAFAAPSVVKIACNHGVCTLVRNGKPYFVKGAVGGEHLEQLVAAGGNSIRASADSLDSAQALGLTVLVGLPFGKQRQGFDYSDAGSVQRQRDEIKQIVLSNKDHPAVLAWAIGNELEIRTTPEQRAVLYQEINRVSQMIHQLDPNHPVITPVGDAYRRVLHELDQYAPDLDAVGLNSYADMLTLPEDVAREGWRKPYLITEFGPRGHWQVARTAWGLPIEDTSTEKAAFYLKAYRHAVTGQPMCLGSYAFHWAQHHEKTHTWYGMFLEDGSRTEAVDVMTFLWSGKWPANRSPTVSSAGIQVKSNNPTADAAATFLPATVLHCAIQASDPNGDPLKISWDLRKDVSGNKNTGGDKEEPTPPIPEALLHAEGNTATIQLPRQEGPYRIFVYVRDGHGNAATANLPVLVKPQ